MLTFNVVLGYQGLLFLDFLCFFFSFFIFQSDRPTQYQETHSTLNEKKGDGLKMKDKPSQHKNAPLADGISTHTSIYWLVKNCQKT